MPKLRQARSTPEAVKEVHDLLPDSFKTYYDAVCKLQYEDMPDYNGLRRCIAAEITRINEFYDETGQVVQVPKSALLDKNKSSEIARRGAADVGEIVKSSHNSDDERIDIETSEGVIIKSVAVFEPRLNCIKLVCRY